MALLLPALYNIASFALNFYLLEFSAKSSRFCACDQTGLVFFNLLLIFLDIRRQVAIKNQEVLNKNYLTFDV